MSTYTEALLDIALTSLIVTVLLLVPPVSGLVWRKFFEAAGLLRKAADEDTTPTNSTTEN